MSDVVDELVQKMAETTADGIRRAADLAERLVEVRPQITVREIIAAQREAAAAIERQPQEMREDELLKAGTHYLTPDGRCLPKAAQ